MTTHPEHTIDHGPDDPRIPPEQMRDPRRVHVTWTEHGKFWGECGRDGEVHETDLSGKVLNPIEARVDLGIIEGRVIVEYITYEFTVTDTRNLKPLTEKEIAEVTEAREAARYDHDNTFANLLYDLWPKLLADRDRLQQRKHDLIDEVHEGLDREQQQVTTIAQLREAINKLGTGCHTAGGNLVYVRKIDLANLHKVALAEATA